jgi:hypothetical protein
MTPTSGRVLSGKALARRVMGLPSEPVPDADASYPLKGGIYVSQVAGRGGQPNRGWGKPTTGRP